MINLGDKPIFLKKGRDLAFAFDRALANLLDALRFVLPTFEIQHRRALLTVITMFKWLLGKTDNVEEITLVWFEFSVKSASNIQSNINSFLETFPPECPKIFEFQGKVLRNIIKLFFMFLYKERVVLLPNNFERPNQAEWIKLVFTKFEVLPKCLASFQKLSDWDDSYAEAHPIDYTYRGRVRIYQTGMKFFLTSDWYEPKDINIKDMISWKSSFRSIFNSTVHEIPFRALVAHINADYPGELSDDVLEGGEYNGGLNPDQLIIGCLTNALSKNLEEGNASDPIMAVADFFKLKSLTWIEFGPAKIDTFGLVGLMASLGMDISKAYELWLSAQNYFLNDKQYEDPSPHLTQLGRLNVYILVYLPLWHFKHPESKVVYPESPNIFNSSVHYDCKHTGGERPLSLVEFYHGLELPVTGPNHSTFRLLFDCLQANPSLPGCAGLVQPIKRLPVSKKYPEVVKNIFPGEQFPLFIDFLYAVDQFMIAAEDNAKELYRACANSSPGRTSVATESFGFVPVVFFQGKIIPVLKLDASVFTFLEYKGEVYLNPGSTRFSLFMLETGPRGQTAQWLDADTYDKAADRISTHPMQLTCLYLNTDKVHEVPIIIVSINRALLMLDSQRSWRNSIIAAGVPGFKKRVMYDRKQSSKWGKILPLFAANPISGVPFSDGQYHKFWTGQCFSFQLWLRDSQIANEVLVAHLPVRSDGEKDFFTWDDWVSGINPAKVKVVAYADLKKISNPHRYLGDYCPVLLRAKVTPHGARASFVTSMSTVLCPSAIKLLTGQRETTVHKYNKGRDVLYNSIQGAFNNRDDKLSLLNVYDDLPAVSYFSSGLEGLRRLDNFEEAAGKSGWFSIAATSKEVKQNGLQIIATDRARRIGYEYTHACACNFQCPVEVVLAYGLRNCAFCPYAIYNVNNIAAVAAKRQQLADDFFRMCDLMDDYLAGGAVADSEKSLLSEKLEFSARELLQWRVVEESLWAMVVVAKSEVSPVLLSSDKTALWTQITRFGVEVGSSEEFLMRLGEAKVFGQSVSEDFRLKVDRATRLLMARNGDVSNALLMPVNFSTVDNLIGMIRSNPDFEKLDLDEFVRLINLSSKDWMRHIAQFEISKFLAP